MKNNAYRFMKLIRRSVYEITELISFALIPHVYIQSVYRSTKYLKRNT